MWCILCACLWQSRSGAGRDAKGLRNLWLNLWLCERRDCSTWGCVLGSVGILDLEAGCRTRGERGRRQQQGRPMCALS